MTKQEYYAECISNSLDELNLSSVISSEDINKIASDILISVENQSLAFYEPENPLISTVKDLKKSIEDTQQKYEAKIRLYEHTIASRYGGEDRVTVNIKDNRVEVYERR